MSMKTTPAEDLARARVHGEWAWWCEKLKSMYHSRSIDISETDLLTAAILAAASLRERQP